MKVNFANESLKNEKKVREINMKKKNGRWRERKRILYLCIHLATSMNAHSLSRYRRDYEDLNHKYLKIKFPS